MTSLLTSIRSTLPALLLVVLAFGAHALADSVWQNPTGAPTSGNGGTDNVLNIGATTQTKAGGLTTSGAFGSTRGYVLSTTTPSQWFISGGLTTFLAQQFCIGTDINNPGNDNCVTSWSGGGGSGIQIQRTLVKQIPGNVYYWPILDYCASALQGSGISGLKASDGWVATGEDGCAEYGGDGDNCNGIGNGPLQCNYMRVLIGGTPVPAVSQAFDYRYNISTCTMSASPVAVCQGVDSDVYINWATTQTGVSFSITTPSGKVKNFTEPPVSGEADFFPAEIGTFTGTVTLPDNSKLTCTVATHAGSQQFCNGKGNNN